MTVSHKDQYANKGTHSPGAAHSLQLRTHSPGAREQVERSPASWRVAGSGPAQAVSELRPGLGPTGACNDDADANATSSPSPVSGE
jgi:hypothetical protein